MNETQFNRNIIEQLRKEGYEIVEETQDCFIFYYNGIDCGGVGAYVPTSQFVSGVAACLGYVFDEKTKGKTLYR